MGNHALRTNARVFRHADLEITTAGSDWYFSATSIMGASALIVMALSFTRPRTHRLFHYISALLLWVATIAYFSMGSNLGQVPIPVEWSRPGDDDVSAAGTREVFYVRYIDWFVTTPLLLLDLLLTVAMPWPSILVTILADEIMIVCGLVGALTQTRYKWAYWSFGTGALFFVVYMLVVVGRSHATALGGSIKRTYNMCGVLTIFIWFLYPVAWGLSEGGNIIHPDSEAAFYGVLDVIAKPVFTLLLLWGHRTIDPVAIGLHIREPGQTSGFHEKHQHGGEHGHLTGNRNGANHSHHSVDNTTATTTGSSAV